MDIWSPLRRPAKRGWRSLAVASAIAAVLLGTTGVAIAGPPRHLSLPVAGELSGFDHPCGVAIDTSGDLYVSSAGVEEIRIFDPEHHQVGSITESEHEPCGLAVDSHGNLYVSEKAVREIARYHPTESTKFPLSGSPSYDPREIVDPSGEAEGISVDPKDDRLYVAEGTHIRTYSGRNEVQRVSVGGTVTSGEYALGFKGPTANPIPSQVTGLIKHDADAAEVKAALVALPAIEPSDVEVKKITGLFGVVNDVIFTGAYEDKNIEQLELDGSLLIGGGGFITTRIDAWEGSIDAGGALAEATGVAAYTYQVSVTENFNKEVESEKSDRYLFVADRASNQVKVLVGRDPFGEQLGERLKDMKLRQAIDGPSPGEHFGFGPAGAYLAVDGGNDDEEGKCVSVHEQACTAGHLLVYDQAHTAIDEFEADGEFLDQLSSPSLEDAEPTAIAIERSEGTNDGDIYVTSGSGAGGAVLAFEPLAAPSRKPLPTLSRKLPGASAIATDSHGDVYVAAGGGRIRVFSPTGVEIEVGSGKEGIVDEHDPLALAIDSAGLVYVVDENEAGGSDETVTYYTPSAYPPVDGTTYVRHEPPVASEETEGFEANPKDVTINATNDHLLVLGRRPAINTSVVGEFSSAKEGSEFTRLSELGFGSEPAALDVYGNKSDIYATTSNAGEIEVAHDDPSNPPAERRARITGGGCPGGKLTGRLKIAVDQSNGHLVAFSPSMAAGREYDASGACVAEFYFPEPQRFGSTGLKFDIAMDNACAIHRNKVGEPESLDETTTPTCAQFDPGNGNVYVAYDDPKPEPDLWTFAPLSYGEAPLAKTGVASAVGASGATLNGSVNPHGFELEECVFEWGESEAYGHAEPCAESSEEIGNGSGIVPVHLGITGIEPGSKLYHFRLRVKNKFGADIGADSVFGPPKAITESANPVLYDEAFLRAQVEPSGLTTNYHFDYVDQQGFEEQGGLDGPATLHTVEGTIPAGATPSKVKVKARLSDLEEGTTYHFRAVAGNEAAEDKGAEKTLTTLTRLEQLPCPNDEYRTGASARLSDCRAYELVTPAEMNGQAPFAAGSNNFGGGFDNWLVTPRGEGAGEAATYFTRGTIPGFGGNGTLDGYRAQRATGEGPHPKAGWSSVLSGPTYAQAVPDLSHNIDVRGVSSDQLFSFWFVDPALSLPESLVPGTYLSTPSGFEAVGRGALGTDYTAASRYVSPGGAHVIFTSSEELESSAPPAGTEAIYDRAAGSGEAEVLSAPPAGASPAVKAEFENEDAKYLGSTEDGSTALFEVGGTLYARSAGQTTEIATPPSTFAAVSQEGKRVFYADTAAGDISMYESGTQTKIAEEATFVNASADGSHVFFTSEEEGNRNLYAWDGTAEPDLVAQLSPADPTNLPSRSTPDGKVFVFLSRGQLGTYDNEGEVEIYRYDSAEGKGLTCISCNPAGTAPSGDAAFRYEGTEDLELASATLIQNATDNGERVFFESPDRLLPEDANAVTDVYEWTAGGVGDCGRSGGCLALISSGQGEGGNHLYGMSANGHDVVFFTTEKLVGQDTPGSPSLYDAREEGGIPEPAAKAPCAGDACQGEGSQPPPLAMPASPGSGGGNIEGHSKRRCPKGKLLVRRHGKARCVKRHAHKHRHQRPAGRSPREKR